MIRFRFCCFCVSHSQITIVLQSSLRSARWWSLSRAALPLSFFSHHSRRWVGVAQLLHPLCRCQKQPWTKMAVLYFGRTMSTETERGYRFRVSCVTCHVSGGIG